MDDQQHEGTETKDAYDESIRAAHAKRRAGVSDSAVRFNHRPANDSKRGQRAANQERQGVQFGITSDKEVLTDNAKRRAGVSGNAKHPVMITEEKHRGGNHHDDGTLGAKNFPRRGYLRRNVKHKLQKKITLGLMFLVMTLVFLAVTLQIRYEDALTNWYLFCW